MVSLETKIQPMKNSAQISTAVSDLESHVGYWLRYVSNHVSDGFRLKVEARGVTVSEWVVMRELLDTPESSPSALVAAMGMSKGGVSKLLVKLEVKLLVTRTTCTDDRRNQTVALTEAGRALTAQLAQLADENDAEFFGFMTVDERTLLVRLLQTMVRHHGWNDVPVE